jgi:exonuclease VII small subunit
MLRNFEKYGNRSRNIEGNDKMDETTEENVELTEDKSLTQLQNDFHAASRNWRRQINNLNYQLVNERNIESLEKGSQALIRLMRELTEAQERLDKILESEMERITVFGRFETMSQETNQILKEVGAVICDLKKIDDNRCPLHHQNIAKNLGKANHLVILL